MFFIFLFLLLSIVLAIVFAGFRIAEINAGERYWGVPTMIYGWSMIVCILVFLIVTPVCIFSAVELYPELKAEKQGILTLENEINLIESGHYTGIQSGQLVGGSLDNLGQSVTYTEYLKIYVDRKARFNERLVEIQEKCNLRVYRIFGYYGLVPGKVRYMKKLNGLSKRIDILR